MAIVGLVVLNIFDILLTRRALALGATEANPLMAPFVESGWGIAIKTALPVAFGIRHLRAPLRSAPGARPVLGVRALPGRGDLELPPVSQPHLVGTYAQPGHVGAARTGPGSATGRG